MKVLQHEIPRCVDFGGDNLYRPQTMLDYITFRKSTMMRLNWQDHSVILVSTKGSWEPEISCGSSAFRSLAEIARSCTRELNKTLLLFLYFDETQALFYRKSISEAIFQQRVSCTPLRSAHYCTRSVTYGGSCNISVDFFNQSLKSSLFGSIDLTPLLISFSSVILCLCSSRFLS